MRYQFRRTVVAEGVTYHDGQVVYAQSLPAGSIPGLLRMGHVAEFVGPEDPPPEPPPSPPHAPAHAAHPKRPAKK